MNNKKFFGWLTIISLIITVSFVYKAYKLITHLQSEVDEYFLYTPDHTEQTTVIIGAIIALFLTTLVGTKWFNARNIIIFVVVSMSSGLNAQTLLGYTTKSDTFTVVGRKNMNESDLKIWNRSKALVAFYKEQEKKEHRNGRPFFQLRDNGLPVFWRDMPVYVLQRERKDTSSGKARRIIYDVHVVAHEMLNSETTYFEWVIIQ